MLKTKTILSKKESNPCAYLPKYEEIVKIVCHSKQLAFTKPNNHSNDRSTNVVYSVITVGLEVCLLAVKMEYKKWKFRTVCTVVI